MVVDGVELLRMIRDGEIEEYKDIKDLESNRLYYFDGHNIVDRENYKNLLSNIPDLSFTKKQFEILSEEEEEIDIDSIEELKFLTGANDNELDIGNKLNEVIKAVKQLNRKIK